MNTFIRTTIAGASAAALTLLPVGLAMADTTNLTNTGNNVLFVNGLGDSTAISVSNSNSSSINQSAVNTTNTGGNKTNGNIGGASVTTGQASASSSMAATTNTNQTTINNVGNGNSDDAMTITNTGDNLQVSGNGGSSTSVGVSNSNSATVSQSVTNSVSTGGNKTNDNIGDVAVTTGNAGVANVMGVQANGNMTGIGGLGFGGGLNFSLTNTGDDVTIGCDQPELTEVVLDQEVVEEPINEDVEACGDALTIGVMNSNGLSLTQMATNNVNTGDNRTNDNIALDGAVSVETGDVAVMNTMSVVANTNTTGIDLGEPTEDDADTTDVVNTGDNLWFNLGGTSVTTTVNVVSANSATGTQMAVNAANTGDNKTNDNIANDGDNVMVVSGNSALGSLFGINANANLVGLGMMPNVLSMWGLLLGH